MPSLRVGAPCSLLAWSGWLKTAGTLSKLSKRAGRAQSPLSGAATSPHSTALPPRCQDPPVCSSPFWREQVRRS